MNRNLNTTLLMIGMTVLNLATIVGSFVLISALYGRLIAPHVDSAVGTYAPILFLMMSFTISFIVHSAVMGLVQKKVDVSKYFAGLLRKDKKKPEVPEYYRPQQKKPDNQ